MRRPETKNVPVLNFDPLLETELISNSLLIEIVLIVCGDFWKILKN